MFDCPREHDGDSDFLRGLQRRLSSAGSNTIFLSACAQYLSTVERANREQRVELSLQRDELEYMRAKWRSAEEHIVELEDRLQQAQFSQQLHAIGAVPADADADNAADGAFDDAAQPGADNELQFDSDLDAYVFGTSDCDTSLPVGDDNLHRIVPPPADHHHIRAILVTDYFARRLHDGGDFALAAPVCRHIIANAEAADSRCTVSAADERLLAAAHELLSMHERAHGRMADAAGQLQRAVDIFERTLHADDPTLCTTQNNLSLLYRNSGQLERARQCCARALELRCGRYGDQLHLSVARQHHTMATIERELHANDRALVHLAEAVRGYAGARHVADPDNPQPYDDARTVRDWMRRCRSNMSQLYGQAGRWSEAAAVLKQWLHELVPETRPGRRPIWERALDAERTSSGGGGSERSDGAAADRFRRWCERLAEPVRAEALAVLRQLAAVYQSMGMLRAAAVLLGKARRTGDRASTRARAESTGERPVDVRRSTAEAQDRQQRSDERRATTVSDAPKRRSGAQPVERALLEMNLSLAEMMAR